MTDGDPGALARNSQLFHRLALILPGICLLAAVFFAYQFVSANSAAGSLAAAPVCSAAQMKQAMQQALDCVASVPGTVSMGINSGTSNAVEIYYGTRETEHLLVAFTNVRDFQAVTNGVQQSGGTVTMNVWRGGVVTVIRNEAAFPTTGDPGPRAVTALWSTVIVLAAAGVLRMIFGRLRLMAGVALVRRQRHELAELEARQNGPAVYGGPGTQPVPNIPRVQPMYVPEGSGGPSAQPEQFTLRDFRMPKYGADLPQRPQGVPNGLRSRIEKKQQQ